MIYSTETNNKVIPSLQRMTLLPITDLLQGDPSFHNLTNNVRCTVNTGYCSV